MYEALLHRNQLSPDERTALDRDGYVLLPGLLQKVACGALTTSLQRVARRADEHDGPRGAGRALYDHYAAEHDGYLARLIAHPEMLKLARSALGNEIRYDHCVTLNRKPGYPGLPWHGHAYADDEPRLRFLRIFFYVGGFGPSDAALQVVPGSHHFRDPLDQRKTDDELRAQWLVGKRHPETGEPLRIEVLQAPERTVILMWTHTLHGVTPGPAQRGTRWAVVYGYRNPGRPSLSRWISEEFERRAPAEARGLMSRY